MRPTIVLLAALLAAGCGGSRHARPGAPPGFLLISDAGRQQAARGSFCQQTDSMGLCGDTGRRSRRERRSSTAATRFASSSSVRP
jgi:hypothetical protein